MACASSPELDTSRLIDARDAMRILGVKKSAFYSEVHACRIPKAITRGDRFSRWPLHEIRAIRIAWMGGASEEALLKLVVTLTTFRQHSMTALSNAIDAASREIAA